MVNTFRQTPLEGIYSHKKGPKIAITYQSNPVYLHTPSCDSLLCEMGANIK